MDSCEFVCFCRVLFFGVAEHALMKLNHTFLNGKPIRIMWSQRDPDARNNGVGNLFVKVNQRSYDGILFFYFPATIISGFRF